MIQGLYETCGYVASFIGTFIEGEILLLTSVISSKLGYFNFFGGLTAAFLGAFLRDTLQFLLVKKQGKKLLAKKPKLQSKLDNASGWFNKSPFIYLTVYRFMYGFSTVIIMLSGLKDDISYPRFALHSAIGIGLWIGIIGGFGYFCADAMIEKLNFISEYSLQVIGVLALTGLAYWFFIKRPKDKHCFTPKLES
jgi:membrane protein DedA with SNARE-associated domain